MTDSSPEEAALPAIAAYLRELARRLPALPNPRLLQLYADQLDVANNELQFRRTVSALIRVAPTPEHRTFMQKLDSDWQSTQAEIDAEIASGA